MIFAPLTSVRPDFHTFSTLIGSWPAQQHISQYSLVILAPSVFRPAVLCRHPRVPPSHSHIVVVHRGRACGLEALISRPCSRSTSNLKHVNEGTGQIGRFTTTQRQSTHNQGRSTQSSFASNGSTVYGDQRPQAERLSRCSCTLHILLL